jgi:hypothetical protein
MKSIKKFSTEMNQPKSILESLDSTTLDELIKGMGFKNIHELKREKNLLSKLEALVKEVNQKPDLNEDDADDIEDDILKKGKPKSLEDKSGEKEPEVIIGSKEDEMEIAEEETEEETEEEFDGEETEEESDEDEEIEKEEESAKTPKATRKIMAFEDFIKENTVFNYNDDEADVKFDESLKEGVGTVALGIMVAFAGIKLLKLVAGKVVRNIGKNVKLPQNELKDISMELSKAVAAKTGTGLGVIQGLALKKSLDDKIDSGEISSIKDIEKHLKDYLDNNLNESQVNEAKVKSNDEFKEYAFTVLQNAFGDDFDEIKAQEVVDGLTSKYSGDYGAMVGALKASLGQ